MGWRSNGRRKSALFSRGRLRGGRFALRGFWSLMNADQVAVPQDVYARLGEQLKVVEQKLDVACLQPCIAKDLEGRAEVGLEV